ncbi:MAG: hypothetical protein QMD00_03935, partial [Hadesarchaea archaeon]|nr:hypothetical protein [Hadesarchaea archaeon]
RKIAAVLSLAIIIYLIVGLFVEMMFGVGTLLSVLEGTPQGIATFVAFLLVLSVMVGLLISKKL